MLIILDHLQVLYQKQLELYQQQSSIVERSEASFNTAALVTHLVQQGGLVTHPSAEQHSSDPKSAVDKDVAITVESFLRSMANDAAGIFFFCSVSYFFDFVLC